MKKQAKAAKSITIPPDIRVHRIASEQNAPFAATLSPAELLLAKEIGYQPIAPVIGTSVIQVGQMYALMSKSRESPLLTGLIEGMWHAAVVRIQEQARILGASGVVAVDIQAWGMECDKEGIASMRDDRAPLERDDILRVTLAGTAVQIRGLPANSLPFVCSLTGQEMCTLAQAGFRPVGFAYGNCVWSQVSRQTLRDRRNKEVTGMTLAIYRARRLAVERAEKMAATYSGEGILSLKMRFNMLEFARGSKEAPSADVALSLFAGGTVITSQPSDRVPAIDYSLLLSDRLKQGEH